MIAQPPTLPAYPRMMELIKSSERSGGWMDEARLVAGGEDVLSTLWIEKLWIFMDFLDFVIS